MGKNKQFTGYIAPSLWDEVHEECEDNGYQHCIALKVGLEYYLAAPYEERIKLIRKYNTRADK